MQTWIRSASVAIALFAGAAHALNVTGEARGGDTGDRDPGAPAALPGPLAETGGLTNLGRAAVEVRLVGTHALLRLSESAQNATSLNGDTDALDEVLATYDVSTGELLVLGAALDDAAPVRFDGDYAWFFVDEAAQGQSDLNADGDKDDLILHVVPFGSALALNLGLAAVPTSLVVDGGHATFAVREGKQGNTDLNGDGDKIDEVWFVFDAGSGVLDAVGLAIDSATLAIAGNYAIAGVNENDEGKLDLNGDGDTSDAIAHVFDRAHGSVHSLGQAVISAAISGSTGIFRVSESNNAGLDLNGDGDTSDNVLVSSNLSTGISTSLGLAVVAAPVLEGPWLVAIVGEAAQGAGDLNGDGDTSAADKVLHLVDLASGNVVNARLAISTGAAPLFVTDGQRFAVWVDETAQAKHDRNGDGDTVDTVIGVFDAGSATSVNLGTIGKFSGGEGGRALVYVSEMQQGAGDLNGDGDVFDDVLYALDATAQSGASLGVATEPALAASIAGDRIAFVVSEDAQGVDANQDGDLVDSVMVIQPFGFSSLAGASFAVGGLAYAGNFVLALVDEGGEGVDLNGDFDHADLVAHVVFGGVPPTVYCTGKPNSAGCVPSIGSSGTAFLSDDQMLYLFATQMLMHKNVVFWYGLGGPDAAPFAGGTLCSKAPHKRSPLGVTGGGVGACGGAIAFNFEAYIESGQDPELAIGVEVCGQFVSRDPFDAAGNYVSLTDAIRLTIAP
ncbi:MAG: hypothetical protein HZA52_15345 [Planctomycetes bacterium]|nr:hypothetical protein [Planctomycetota bacterium]